MKRIKSILLLATLLVLLVGIASATNVSTDTTSTDTVVDVSTDTIGTDTTVSVVEDTTPTMDAKSESVMGKQLINNEKNYKKEETPINEDDYNILNNMLTETDEDWEHVYAPVGDSYVLYNLLGDERLYGELRINITQDFTLLEDMPFSEGIKLLTIEGNQKTINGAGQYRFLEIPSGSTVNINNLIVTNCHSEYYGGAIDNGGNLTITGSNFIDNTATGQDEGYGGAIDNYGVLRIIDSNFTHNTAGYGGAIINEYNLSITGSNFIDNTATGQDAGYGGAIDNYGVLTITGSNFTHNIAENGGAIHNYEGSVKSTYSTFDLNTPANYKINNEKHIQLENNDSFIPEDATYAIYLDDEEECVYTGSLNGYTVPKNHKIRLVVNGTDTNAFGNNTFVLYSYDKIVANYTQLVEAVEDAKESSEEEYSIYLYPGDYNATANMKWGDTTSSIRKLIINGNNITLDGINNHQFMYVSSGYTLTLKNIIITNYTEECGGAIDSSGNVIIINSTFTNNTAKGNYGSGGAINNNGNITLINSNLTYNTAIGGRGGYGGAIYSNNGGNVTITGSNFKYNNAKYRGGAIHVPYGGTLNITGSSFKCNTVTESPGYGGAIYNQYGGTLIIKDSNLTDNTATGQNGNGGAIYNNGTANITGSNLKDNNVTGEFGSGGAIHVSAGGIINITNSNFIYNNAQGNYGTGAAIHNEGTLAITDSNFTYNNATYCGGAIYNVGSYTLNISTSHLTDNSAEYGGAISNVGILNITDSELTDNTALQGGAIQNWKIVSITGSNLTNNSAIEFGGAIYNNKGTINITGSNLTYNNATSGGAIHNYNNGNITINNSNLTHNNATGQNGDGRGGAIDNEGTLIITDSNLTYNTATGPNGTGGAIYNKGTLNITDSNLTYNTATGQVRFGRGGAIYNNGGNLTITHSNLKNNTATGQQDGVGGAIYNTGGTININNSNLTYNTATGQTYEGYGGAIYNIGGTLNITQSNLTHNNATGQNGDGRGGAIHNDFGTLTINNSNLTDNTATGQEFGYGGAIYTEYDGTLTITDSNLTHNTVTGQEFGYGGAIFNPLGTLNITNSNLTYNTATGEHGYGGAIYNRRGTLNINNSNLTYNNATGENYGEGGAIYTEYDGTLTITYSNLTYNTATGQNYGDGGAIYNWGTLNINNSNLTYNTATGQNYGYGGAIENVGILNITDSNLIYNTATGQNKNGHGGAISNANTLNINNSNLTYNTATGQNYGYGGAIYNLVGILNINNNNLTHNTATGQTNGYGGAISNDYGTLNITDSNLTHNNATGQNGEGRGGALYNGYYGTLNINNSNLTNNNATYGGAIVNNATNSNLTMFDSKLENNHATSEGGAIYNGGYAFIEGNTFITNTAGTSGSAIKDDTGSAMIHDNINADTSTYSSTIYTNGSDVSIISNLFYELNSNITISSNNSNPSVFEVVNLTFLLKDQLGNPLANQIINITIDDIKYNITTNDEGYNTLEYTIQANETIINAIYPGNDKYFTNTASVVIYAQKLDTQILVDDVNTKVGDQFTINGTLSTKDNTPLKDATINITVNDKTNTTTTNENGQFNMTFTLQKMGEYSITVTYPGDKIYNQSINNTAKVTATKTDTKLTLTVSNTTPVNSTPINITATLTDTNGNKLANQNVIITVAGKTYTVKTNNNGVAIQSYTPTKTETQTITATYKGDNKYVNSTATANITVKKINTKLSIKVSNTTPVNNTSINITATLTDTNGNKLSGQNITFTIAGKTYTVKTDKNGVATKAYTPTTLGKQTITATYKGDSKYVNSTATTSITVKKINTKITLQASNTTPINNTPITITAILTDASGNKLAGQNIILNINGKNYTLKTDSNGSVTESYTPTVIESQTITATYNGNSMYNNTTKSVKITVKNKIKTKTTVTPVSGVIGEKVTIKVTVMDTNGNNVNEGNLIFKVNGVTIKDNGKLTGSNNPLKIKVVNGVATATIIPDINMTNAKNITAYYIGTTTYNASTSTPASINISKRNATIEVSINKKIIKQGQVLTITAKIYDTTGGKKTTNITKYQDEYVYFKVNGITLKDADGNMLKVKIVNGTATVNYTIPLGISCVTDMQTLTPKNHTIQVGLYNKNYQNIMTKTPTFQVERSNITINIANATINNKTHTLSMKITIKDYLKNTVAGPNKCIIKVNGVTLKNGTNVQYYYTTDGVLDIKNIPVPQSKNYTGIEVITQDRLAYNSQRNTTKVIKITN